ncbi:MAG: hypothetical protein ABGX27_01635 [Desulfurobacteriaceae bacterium]
MEKVIHLNNEENPSSNSTQKFSPLPNQQLQSQQSEQPKDKVVNPKPQEEKKLSEPTKTEEVKKEIESLASSLSTLIEKLIKGYEEKIKELETKVEDLEQENLELRYKLHQLSNDLRSLSEKITTEYLQRARKAFEEVEKLNRL